MVYLSVGEEILYQPLTRQDRITVVLYRTGIVCSTLALCLAAALSLPFLRGLLSAFGGWLPSFLLIFLYASVGVSVFFIHLYVGKFHRFLKKLYYAGLICLGLMSVIGGGNPGTLLMSASPYYAVLLLPLSFCLGFVTAKEAFCFRLLEGYIIAMVMPAFIVLYASGALSNDSASVSLLFIAVLLVLFTLRKTFMPLHFDIGDKSAYQP